MAGIGFQLKELFNESGVFKTVKAYSYSALVTVGPMFLCILLITFSKELLLHLDAPIYEADRFLAAVEYAFIFSQVITGGFSFSISRFIADQTYLKKEEYVLSSMYGLIAVCVAIGSICSWLLYYNSPLPFLFKLVTYIFFLELIIIWIQCMYVSAIKDYVKIAKSFVYGVVVAGGLLWISYKYFDLATSTTVFICLDIGFLVIVLKFTQYIKQFFRVNNHEYFRFLIYLEKYPSLFLSGFFYVAGLYAHNIIVWQGDLGIIVDHTFRIAPFYDVPVFFAYLTVLPAMILFMVSVETNFYEVHRKYYYRILNGFPLKDIIQAKKELYKVVSVELSLIAEVQVVVSFISLGVGIQLLPLLGMTGEQVHIFIILTLSNFFFILLYTIVIILLYFDDRQGAFRSTMTFSALMIISTIILSLIYDMNGISVFIASFLTVIYTIRKLIHYLNNIDYYTFCTQPVVFIEKVTKTEQILKKFNSIS